MNNRLSHSLVCTILLSTAAWAASPGPSLTVDWTAPPHPISPYIYGVNEFSYDAGTIAFARELQIPVNRWGGNATSRYNWKVDAHNTAADWYFSNYPDQNDPGRTLPDGSSFDMYVEKNRSTGTATICTIPMMGWVVRDRERRWGFSVAKYGAQEKVDPWQKDAGNGVKPDGKTNVTGNDPHDTSMAVGPEFVMEWVQHLVSRYGTAANGGVKFYNLDNEPDWWYGTHRDIHPDPATYDEVRNQTFLYAPAVKAGDSTALTLGPATGGWWSTVYMSTDWINGWRVPPYKWWANPVDRKAHGDLPFIVWYLQEMRRYEQEHGLRILDYVDIHGYLTPSNIAFQPAGDAALQALRLESTRILWDPSYRSTDGDMKDDPDTGGYIAFIPRLRRWIEDHYPGTKTAITEYNWGAMDHINGALTQADIFGIFGREQLDLATIWGPPKPTEPGAFAFRMYLNYDGAGGKFGDLSLHAQSSDQGRLSLYAARRSQDGRLTLMVINKTGEDLESQLTLSGLSSSGSARVFRYSPANLTAIEQQSDQPLTADSFTTTFPANSITLFEIQGSRFPARGGLNPGSYARPASERSARGATRR